METETIIAPEEVETVESAARPKRSRGLNSESWLYRVIWRWHFYAGLIVAPVILVAAVTGGIYVFAEEIEDAVYHDIYFVTPQQTAPLSFERQIEGARALAAPGEEPAAIQLTDDDPARATAIAFHTTDERHRYVFVNPYTSQATGQKIYEEGFMAIVLDIHRTLLAGDIGRIVVELATGWGIILAVTGIYLWWPRRREKVRGVWTLRIKTKPYTFVRDLHTVPGFYVSIFAVIVLVTGLFFSYFFGQGYWLASGAMGALPQEFVTPPVAKEGPRAPIDQIVAAVRAQKLHPRIYLSYPHEPTETYVAYIGDAASPTTRSAAWVDPVTSEVIAVTTWDQATAMFKMSLLSYPLHVGSIYGLPTKILAVLVCLLFVAMTITGVIMWWMRRPKGKAGFPRKPDTRRFPVWLPVVIVVLGVLVPTVGLTILLLLLWDGVLFARRKLFARTAN